jgi:hypothetical protein
MHPEYCLPRVEGISAEEFESRFLQPQKPCIVSNLKRWPAYQLWDRGYLRRAYGDTVVRASQSVNHRHPDLSHVPTPPPTIRLKFADYVDLVWSGAAAARHLFVIGDNIPIYKENGSPGGPESPLRGDVKVPELVDRNRLHFVGFWLSAQGTESCLHHDANGCHNLNVQVRGKKRVVMCSPDRCELLYPYPRTGLNENFGQFSRVNPFEPDLARYPLYADAGQWTGMLETGDALFIPAYWYHAFRHEGEANINVNFWWLPDRQFVNGVTVREAFIAALSGNGVHNVLGKIDAFGGEAGDLLLRLETALLNPTLPGRSERI